MAKLIDVATGGQDLKKADPQYKELLSSLKSVLGKLGLQQPISWESLSDWRGHWRANFETYKERKDYINDLVSVLRLDLDGWTPVKMLVILGRLISPRGQELMPESKNSH